ncbi:MAG: hypothetical protein WKF37_16445 [Bryobacteraceae bacterium]
MDRKDPSVSDARLYRYLEGKIQITRCRRCKLTLRTRQNVHEMEIDSTTADTRLADYLMGLNPVSLTHWQILRWART